MNALKGCKMVTLFQNKSGQVVYEQVLAACDLLNKGGVIAVPTDTIYGLATKVQDSKSLDRIYQIKGRDPSKPLAVCVANIEDISQVAVTSNINERLLSALLPGPVTILLERSKDLNPDLNPGINTVGIRIPDQNFTNALCSFVGPVALTSANRSGNTSPLVIEDFKDIWPEIDGVFDYGVLANRKAENDIQRLGSTVIDLSEPRFYSIIREGCAFNRAVGMLHRFGYRKK